MSRTMRMLLVVAFTACSLFASRNPAVASQCPAVRFYASADGNQYFGYFTASSKIAAAAQATFYTTSASYAAALPAVVDVSLGSGKLRSKIFGIGRRPNDDYVAALVAIPSLSDERSDPCIYRTVIPETRRDTVEAKNIEMLGRSESANVTTAATFVQNEAPVNCDDLNTEARVEHVVNPVIPPLTMQADVGGTTVVQVELSIDSKPKVSIHSSSGVPIFDEATLQAAAASTYRLATFRCTPYAGRYLFTAAFNP